MLKNKKTIFIKICSIFLFFLLYFLAYKAKDSPSIPAIQFIFAEIAKIVLSVSFWNSLFSTLKIVVIGVVLSLIVGGFLAVLCSAFPTANSLVMPIINSLKNVPSIAMFPLFIVLMGIGDEPRIFVIIWNSFYPIVSSILSGLNSVDKSVVEAAQNCGASTVQLYVHIKIPLSLISLLNGLKISLSNGFVAVVVAEMLGATQGIGYMILWSANAFKYPEMYSYIAIIAFVGFEINAVIEKIILITERKLMYG